MLIFKQDKFHEAIVNLTQQTLESNSRLGPHDHAPGDGDEIMAVERVALEDAGVQAEIAKLQLPSGTGIVIDPWIWGSDGVDDDKRMWQMFMYARDPQQPDSNHYALPLTISPVVSSESMKVIRIDYLPTGKDHTVKEPQPWAPKPANEYIPEAQKLRTDLKPLNVVQPEGASFSATQEGESHVIEWQKWSFRTGFNQREGMVLYDVRYEGRSLFYRLSLSDMVGFGLHIHKVSGVIANIGVRISPMPTLATLSTRSLLLIWVMLVLEAWQTTSSWDVTAWARSITFLLLCRTPKASQWSCRIAFAFTSRTLVSVGSTPTTALVGLLSFARGSW